MNKSKSTMAQQIAQAAIAFEQRRTGNHAPKSVTVVLSEGTLVITLHGALSPAETALARSPAGAAEMQELYRQLFASAADVLHRITEISFNSSLMREMRAIAFATKLIDMGELNSEKHRRMFMHWIGNDTLMSQLGTATQFHPEWSLLCQLRDEGRESASRWLAQNYDDIGVRSTADIDDMFL